jgi:AmmeMemoRadiSam system protein A
MSERVTERELEAAARVLPAAGREAIRAALEEREPVVSCAPEGILAEAAPVFVTLRINGKLRGCIGSLTPLCGNLVEETMNRALAAAFDDPRFPPLTLDELHATSVEVSILRPLEPVDSRDDLDPSRFGIELCDGTGRRAVLLPGIDGVDTVETQIEITRRKAGIPADAPFDIRRFAVLKVPDGA